MKKSTPLSTAMGSFTDFNVWKVELSDEQMKQFTPHPQKPYNDVISQPRFIVLQPLLDNGHLRYELKNVQGTRNMSQNIYISTFTTWR